MAAFRAQGFAQADFKRALGDADKHDVHHDDAADQQRNKGDRRHHAGYRAGKLIHRVINLLHINHRKIVELIAPQLMLVAQFDAGFIGGFLELLAVRGLAVNLQALAATEHPLPRRQWDVYIIVHRIAEHRATLFYDANDRHRQVSDFQRLSDWVFAGKEFLFQIIAENANHLGALDLVRQDEAPFANRLVFDIGHVGGDA